MKHNYKKYIQFKKRILIIGFGSIGQSVLPLLLRHIDIQPSQISILTKDELGADIAEQFGVQFKALALTKDNYETVLSEYLRAGDFLINLSVDVSSVALIKFCQENDILYLDTCIEPWAGGYVDTTVSASMRSNYSLRESALALKSQTNKATAVITHGANPGLVSHLVKQALINIANDTLPNVTTPNNQNQWAKLACQLGVKVIHIAERDTQVSQVPKRPGEFVNTWSVNGFIGEGCQPAELGWGSHERHWPQDAHLHDFGCQSAIYLSRPGAATKVRTWTPLSGPFHGFLITHGESISIAHYLTLKEYEKLLYRPTVHYAYHPCDDAVLSLHELASREWLEQEQQRLLFDEIVDGVDELGVLLMGHEKGAYWFGSQLSIHEARKLAPYNNATSLQVSVSVLAGVIWAMDNPQAGIVEPDEMPYQYILEIATPYLGKLCGQYTDWTPLAIRQHLFEEKTDLSDPWQFVNIRVP